LLATAATLRSGAQADDDAAYSHGSALLMNWVKVANVNIAHNLTQLIIAVQQPSS
jgi:hypothetical protein